MIRFSRRLLAKGLYFVFGQFFDAHEFVIRSFNSSNQLIEFGLNREPVAVLGALNEEHHQKRHDGCAGIYDELPGVGEIEKWTRNSPDEND